MTTRQADCHAGGWAGTVYRAGEPHRLRPRRARGVRHVRRRRRLTRRTQAPTTIEVVRPEQTVIRDVDEELPIVLGGLALLVALGGTGFTLVRMRGMQRRLTH